ncbi:MAG: hypothetical protein GWN58_27625 [Anaerolineae bacterium]|nr:hypothetical protein [Anaerolineae bacterium]
MKILYVFPGWGRSGGARIVGEHINRLVARGYDVSMHSNDGRKPNWFKLNCRLVDGRGLRETYDTVIVTNPTTVDKGLLPAAQRRVYFVQMAEHLFFKKGSPEYADAIRTYRLAARNGFRFITIANWLEKFLRDMGAEDVHQVPNGVNEHHFYPVDQPEPVDDYILIEGDERNQAKDIEGIGWRVGVELRKRYGIKLAGCAATRHGYRMELDEFVMNPSEADYRRLYSGARFLLKASRYEGRSLAPLEAMACGRTTCRAIIKGDDDLMDHVNCLRVGYDYDALLAAASSLVEANGTGLLTTLTHNAARYATKRLRWEPIIDQLERLLAPQT